MKQKTDSRSFLHVKESGCNQEDCLHIFDLLRIDPSWLINASTRNSFMDRIGDLKNILNKKQTALQESLSKAFNGRNGSVSSYVGQKINLQKIELSEARELQQRLQEIGYSVREIYRDKDSLFRALVFGLLEKRVEMQPYFQSADFSRLSLKVQRLLKGSLARLQKNPTDLQLEMEMSVQEISTAWASFLRLLALSDEQKNSENDVANLSLFVGENGQTPRYFIEILSKKFKVPIEVVTEKTQVFNFSPNSILLLHTPQRINLLYSPQIKP